MKYLISAIKKNNVLNVLIKMILLFVGLYAIGYITGATSSLINRLLIERSTSHKIGYWLGSFIGLTWPYLLALIVAYMIFRIIKHWRNATGGR